MNIPYCTVDLRSNLSHVTCVHHTSSAQLRLLSSSAPSAPTEIWLASAVGWRRWRANFQSASTAIRPMQTVIWSTSVVIQPMSTAIRPKSVTIRSKSAAILVGVGRNSASIGRKLTRQHRRPTVLASRNSVGPEVRSDHNQFLAGLRPKLWHQWSRHWRLRFRLDFDRNPIDIPSMSTP